MGFISIFYRYEQKKLKEFENEMLKLFKEQVSLDKDEEQEIMDIIDNLRTILRCKR